MTRGTTTKLEFELPFSSDDVEEINIAFAEGHTLIFDLGKNKIEFDGNKAIVSLSQSDTLKLPTGTVSVQMRVRTVDNEVIASEIMKISVKEILKEGEI